MRVFSFGFGCEVSRKRAELLPALAMLGALLLSACGGGQAPDAKSLIQDAQKAINTDTSFHFKMKVAHPGSSSPAEVLVNSADGDVQKPDKIQGTATVAAGGPVFDVQFVSIGSEQWILTPLSPKWMSATDVGIDLGKVLDPNTGISAVLGDIRNPKNVGDDTVPGDGDCWLVEGTMSAGDLAPITGGDPTSTTPVDTTVCVAKNLDSQGLRQPYQVILKGMAVNGDTAQTTRTFTLSRFNESIDIQPPKQ